MSNWRDDLPEIPGDRILHAAIDEGHRRLEVRRQRLQVVMYSGLGVGAIALLIGIGALFSTGGDDDDDGAAADTTASGTLAGTDTGGTEAPAVTEAAGTTAAAGTTGAPGTTASPGTTTGGTGSPGTTGATETTAAVAAGPTLGPPPETFSEAQAGPPTVYTTVAGSIATMPQSPAVEVIPSNIWEQPAGGPDPFCGDTVLNVIFNPDDFAPQTPIVHWETVGSSGEGPMYVRDRYAAVSLGPFPTSTLDDGAVAEILVYVTDEAAAGDQIFRSETVLLSDCPP
jgi:hypothetical protein